MKLDHGNFLSANYTKEEYEIEREMATKKFEMVLRQRNLKKQLKTTKLQTKWGKKVIKKPTIEADELFKERVVIAKGLKEIQIYENEKLKKMIPDNTQAEIQARIRNSFGVLKTVTYPDGFRHLEDFETFEKVYPDRNINDYVNERI